MLFLFYFNFPEINLFIDSCLTTVERKTGLFFNRSPSMIGDHFGGAERKRSSRGGQSSDKDRKLVRPRPAERGKTITYWLVVSDNGNCKTRYLSDIIKGE